MAEDVPGRLAITSFLAKQIHKEAGKKSSTTPTLEAELVAAIEEVEIETQVLGSPYIKVHLIDPYYTLLTSGFLNLIYTTVTQGKESAKLPERLPDIEVEFPEGSKWWWVLAAVEITNNLTQANVILTFEDRIVYEMREVWGYKTVPAGTQTRAQFVRSMINEVNAKLRKTGREQIYPVIPSQNVVQEVEESQSEKTETTTGKNELGQTTITGEQKSKEKGKVNRSPGIGSGSELKVKGQPIGSAQTQASNEILEVANGLKAPTVAVEAAFFAAIAESGITPSAGNGKYNGVFSGSPSYFPNWASETKRMAEFFFNGGNGFQNGGAIALSRTSNNPVEIAVKVEEPSIWPENAYASESGYNEFLPESQAIINAGGGVRGSLLHGSGSTTSESDVGQLTRGTPENPDEDTWECVQRLAQQVRWYAFVSGMDLTTYKRGRFFYYLDAFDQVRQKPAAYLKMPQNLITNAHTGVTEVGVIVDGMLGNFDDTAYEYQQTHKVKARQQRKSRIAKPSSPSEFRLPLICGPLEYQAGDVFVIQNSGPLDGRWIITDSTRKYIEGPYTTFTLAPPLLPYPEPSASSSSTAGTKVTGTQSVVEQAEKAYAERDKYQYTEEIPQRENNGTLFGPSPRTMDCSAFATLCYKEAGAPDPSAKNYSPIGNTTSMIAHMTKTNNPQPGDLVFYGSEASPAHVVVYIGNGNAIGMEDPATGIAEGPAWGSGNLGEGAGAPVGGEGVAWRLKGEFNAREGG